jgi:D-alanyl-D-alanine endopeptidase (penicillin-binding protein 7)
VADQGTGEVLFEKDADRVASIASITKLMTAMVTIDARLPMDDPVTVTQDDVDTLRNSLSRLPVGWTLTREEMLRLALMASDNRAASALARTFPGGAEALVAAMNAKASALGMGHTRFVDPHGLHAEDASTARDLLLMVNAACGYPPIRRMTTTPSYTAVSLDSGRSRTFGNSDYLVASDGWVVGLSKTGFINESGYCLVLQATIMERPVVMVFLDSVGKHSRQGDAARVRAWLEAGAGDMALGKRSTGGPGAG